MILYLLWRVILIQSWIILPNTGAMFVGIVAQLVLMLTVVSVMADDNWFEEDVSEKPLNNIFMFGIGSSYSKSVWCEITQIIHECATDR